MSDQFYQKVLMEHFKNPKNKKEVENPNFSSGEENPSCGDEISMTGLVEDGKLVDVGFQGKGCVISIATASLLTEECKGKTVEEIMALTKEDIFKMIGMELGPNRLRCALLSLETLHKGLLELTKK